MTAADCLATRKVQYRHVLGHRIAGLTLIAGLACGPAVAGEDLAFYSDRIQEVAHALIADIRPGLDAHSQQVVDDIEILAPRAWETNAAARRGFGSHRVIEFNAGLLAVTDWLSLAMIADWAGHDGCLNEYSDYLAELINHNARRSWKDKERVPVLDFAAYTANTRGHCENALSNSLDHARQQELRDQMLDAIAATVLLHEIAHHVLDHIGGPDKNLLQQRVREREADRWAVATAVNSNYELRRAVPLFLFLAATGGGTLEDEFRRGSGIHPSGLNRVRELLIQSRALLDEKDPVNAHVMDASIDDLNRTLH